MPCVLPLFSGSSGNCTLVLQGDTAVLVDAGVSCRSVVTALERVGLSVSKLNAILLTHEHIDHVRGLAVLWKKYQIPILGSASTLSYLFQNALLPAGAGAEIIEKPVQIGALKAIPFATSHDCPESLGYILEGDDASRAGIATDLGCMTEIVREHLSGSEVIMLESNYDIAMLQCSSYPYSLKRRIRSETGHLSNEDCAKELVGFVKDGAKKLILSHLSKENNLPELALATSLQTLEENGFVQGRDFVLQAAVRNILDEPTVLLETQRSVSQYIREGVRCG